MSIDNLNCVFCKIIATQAPGDILYQDEYVTAFRDIHPVAPIHFLIVPNKHIDSINHLSTEDELIAGRLLITASLLAKQWGIEKNGYRLIINTGKHGGQVVHHLHAHLIGGRRMFFPLG